MVLPLPYAQLLKIVMLSFVFTVPFVLAPTCGIFTPFVSMCLTLGYVGLDCVALGLECPFGVGDENLPLLSIGSELSKSLDLLLRSKARHSRRLKAARGSTGSRCGTGLVQGAATAPREPKPSANRLAVTEDGDGDADPISESMASIESLCA
jgi:hypothetical protein